MNARLAKKKEAMKAKHVEEIALVAPKSVDVFEQQEQAKQQVDAMLKALTSSKKELAAEREENKRALEAVSARIRAWA